MALKIVTKDNLSDNFRIVNYLLEVNIDNETIISDNGVLKTVDNYFKYEQPVPSNHWVIQHNLGKLPIIQTYDILGGQMLPKITHMNENIAIIEFNNTARAGYSIITI